MMFTAWYVAQIQREREESIRTAHLARLAACLRACTDPSLFERVARVLGRSPAAC